MKSTHADGATLKDAQAINKSLFTLAQVIMALAASSKKGNKAHVPYRNSKITELLSDAFGGNAYCMMITCVNPTSMDETNLSLTYASRALNIENKPVQNKVPVTAPPPKPKKKVKKKSSPGAAAEPDDDEDEEVTSPMSMGHVASGAQEAQWEAERAERKEEKDMLQAQLAFMKEENERMERERTTIMGGILEILKLN